MVLEPKTNFYLAKRWFSWGRPDQNHLFTGEKLVFLRKTISLRGKTNKTIFFNIPSPFSKKDVFFVFWFCLVKDGFGATNQLLPRKKMVFLGQTRPKPSIYVGKVGFSMKNHLFTRQNQKTIFFNIPSPFSKKHVFFFVFWFAL